MTQSLKIKLKIDGKSKTFTQSVISARKMRQLFKFYETMEKVEKGNIEKSELETLDEMIVLVADMFDDDAVNFDSILDGLDANELTPTLQGVFEQVASFGQDEKKAATLAAI